MSKFRKSNILILMCAMVFVTGCSNSESNIEDKSGKNEAEVMEDSQEQIDDSLGEKEYIQYVGSGLDDCVHSAEEFDKAAREGLDFYTVSYNKPGQINGKEVKLKRGFSGGYGVENYTYHDNGKIDDIAFTYLYSFDVRKDKRILKETFNEKSVVEDGFRKTMKMCIFYQDDYKNYAMSVMITISPTDGLVRDSLTTTVCYDEYPTGTQKSEFIDACNYMFDTLKIEG